ncbi:hypothetical protein A2U01_0064787, partial [Trifolium medium]|nr:hypothetical protein [Trifolium medium]
GVRLAGTQNVVVVVVVVVGTQIVDMLTGRCILGAVGTQMVEMLMVEMLMRTRSGVDEDG